MKYFLKYCLILTEVSSIILLLLTLLFLVSGYGTIRSNLVRRLTFGLINKHIAERIHTDVYLRLFFNIVLTIHCLFGLILLLFRRIRSSYLRTSLLLITIAIILYFIIPFIIIDLIY